MKTIIVIPTYQEKETISNIVYRLALFDVDVLVIDDNSPDGTARIVNEITKKNSRVHLLLRKEKRGRGYAGIAGFKRCLDMGADYIIEMDADGSHNPIYVPDIINNLKHYDVVLGSRFVPGGNQSGRSLIRRGITRFANWYIRTMFGVKIRDCNSGYRGFRVKVIKKILPKLTASGPDIVQEVLFLINKYGFTIKEIPIEFKDRTVGSSKLKMKNIIRGYMQVIGIKLKRYDD